MAAPYAAEPFLPPKAAKQMCAWSAPRAAGVVHVLAECLCTTAHRSSSHLPPGQHPARSQWRTSTASPQHSAELIRLNFRAAIASCTPPTWHVNPGRAIRLGLVYSSRQLLSKVSIYYNGCTADLVLSSRRYSKKALRLLCRWAVNLFHS